MAPGPFGGSGRPSRRSRGPRRRSSLLLAAAFAAALVLAGCTSEDPSAVGTGLVDARFGALADTVIAEVASFAEVDVREAAMPYTRRQLLYIGREGSIRSQLLASYDFGKVVQRADSLGAAIVPGNIKSASLLLYAVNYYRSWRPDGVNVVQKVYQVRALAGPLVPGDFPGAPPAVQAGVLSELQTGPGTMTLPLAAAAIVEWATAPAAFFGLAVSEDEARSEPGLIGFAAKGFPYPASQLPPQPEGTLLGPVIRIEFNEPAGTFIILLPEEDVSSLTGVEEVPATAAEGLLLQTHVRRYPRLWFDLTALPANVLINQAVLVLTPDTTRSFGPQFELVVSEVDRAAVAANEIELTELARGRVSRIVTGRYGVDPHAPHRIELDVTSTLQRYVNEAILTPVDLMLLAGEDFTGFDRDITDPEYFLARLFFQGTAAADPAGRPHLRIVYTSVPSITGGGAR